MCISCKLDMLRAYVAPYLWNDSLSNGGKPCRSYELGFWDCQSRSHMLVDSVMCRVGSQKKRPPADEFMGPSTMVHDAV